MKRRARARGWQGLGRGAGDQAGVAAQNGSLKKDRSIQKLNSGDNTNLMLRGELKDGGEEDHPKQGTQEQRGGGRGGARRSPRRWVESGTPGVQHSGGFPGLLGRGRWKGCRDTSDSLGCSILRKVPKGDFINKSIKG